MELELRDRYADLIVDPRRGRARARVRQLQADLERMIGELDQQARVFVQEGLPAVYVAGALVAGSQFSWSQIHAEAFQQIAVDTYTDLLTGARNMQQSTLGAVRTAVQAGVERSIVLGDTAQQAGRETARRLAAQGIGSVTYRNGARVGIGTYGEMVLRTKTASAFNVGTLNQGAQLGVEVYEISDGADCGLTAHSDGTNANGMIVDAQTAALYPYAHPNCRRSFSPRLDLTAADAGTFQPSTTPEQREDQAAFERQLAQARAARQARRTARTPRAPRTGRTPAQV